MGKGRHCYPGEIISATSRLPYLSAHCTKFVSQRLKAGGIPVLAYGRVDDPALFLKALGKGGEGLQKAMPAADFFRLSPTGGGSASARRTFSSKATPSTIAVYKETMGGQPNPLEAIETVMHFNYEHGKVITVVLPPEAANAPEVTLPPGEEGSAPEQK